MQSAHPPSPRSTPPECQGCRHHVLECFCGKFRVCLCKNTRHACGLTSHYKAVQVLKPTHALCCFQFNSSILPGHKWPAVHYRLSPTKDLVLWIGCIPFLFAAGTCRLTPSRDPYHTPYLACATWKLCEWLVDITGGST